MILGPRAAYAGSPERDSFRHAGRGACLAVTIAGPGAAPTLYSIETGQFHWSDADLPLIPGASLTALDRLIPPDPATRRNHLMRLRISGRATLAEQAALRTAVANIAPDFAHLTLDNTALASEVDLTDLDAIDRAGALRMAADALAHAAHDGTKSAQDRSISAGALNRLYGYLQGDAS